MVHLILTPFIAYAGSLGDRYQRVKHHALFLGLYGMVIVEFFYHMVSFASPNWYSPTGFDTRYSFYIHAVHIGLGIFLGYAAYVGFSSKIDPKWLSVVLMVSAAFLIVYHLYVIEHPYVPPSAAEKRWNWFSKEDFLKGIPIRYFGDAQSDLHPDEDPDGRTKPI